MEKSVRWGGWQRVSIVALTMMTIVAAGCGGGGGSSTGNPPSAGTAPGTPTISATPATKATVGTAYMLAPSVSDPDGGMLAFSVQNRPSWATFNTTTGRLTGTPGPQDVGTYADVVISVSDGSATAALPAFTITVVAANDAQVAVPGTLTLQWEAPTETVAGTPLAGLAGYRIHYGASASVLDKTIIISNAGTLAYSVADLPAGTYYFAVRAVDSSGGESALSNIQRLVIG